MLRTIAASGAHPAVCILCPGWYAWTLTGARVDQTGGAAGVQSSARGIPPSRAASRLLREASRRCARGPDAARDTQPAKPSPCTAPADAFAWPPGDIATVSRALCPHGPASTSARVLRWHPPVRGTPCARCTDLDHTPLTLTGGALRNAAFGCTGSSPPAAREIARGQGAASARVCGCVLLACSTRWLTELVAAGRGRWWLRRLADVALLRAFAVAACLYLDHAKRGLCWLEPARSVIDHGNQPPREAIEAMEDESTLVCWAALFSTANANADQLGRN